MPWKNVPLFEHECCKLEILHSQNGILFLRSGVFLPTKPLGLLVMLQIAFMFMSERLARVHGEYIPLTKPMSGEHLFCFLGNGHWWTFLFLVVTTLSSLFSLLAPLRDSLSSSMPWPSLSGCLKTSCLSQLPLPPCDELEVFML